MSSYNLIGNPMAIPSAAAARSAALAAKRKKYEAQRAQAMRGAKKRAQNARGRKTEDARPSIFSPEGVAMLVTAIVFDFVPPVIVLVLDFFFGIGEILSWAIDIFATITLGVWIWVRGGDMTFGKKFTRYLKRRAPFIVAEYIPVFGEGPWWTVNVLLFLKK